MPKARNELEPVPDSPRALLPMSWRKARRRIRRWRLYLYILRGVGLLILISILFHDGVQIIAKNAKMLGRYVLNLDVPLPFLLIGLWGLVVLTLSSLFAVNIATICRLLTRSLSHPAPARRKHARRFY